MPNQNDDRLIDHLDKRLSEEEAREIETLIDTDDETRQQWHYLQTAVQAVEYAALYDQVGQAKEKFKASQQINFHPVVPSTKKRVMLRVMGIAAVFALLCLGIVKYAITNPDDVYRQGYQSYSLNTLRSGTVSDDVETAYRNGDWQEVITAFNRLVVKDNKDLFLAGMANMELKQFNEAANKFGQVLKGDNYFHDDAEYYLAMDLLALNKTKEALQIIEKIKADTKHVYHEQAGRLSSLDLKIISYKTGK